MFNCHPQVFNIYLSLVIVINVRPYNLLGYYQCLEDEHDDQIFTVNLNKK